MLWKTLMHLWEVSRSWLKYLDLLFLLRKLHPFPVPVYDWTYRLVYHLPCRTQAAPTGREGDKPPSYPWAAAVQDSVVKDTESAFSSPSPSTEEEAAALKYRERTKFNIVTAYLGPIVKVICALHHNLSGTFFKFLWVAGKRYCSCTANKILSIRDSK